MAGSVSATIDFTADNSAVLTSIRTIQRNVAQLAASSRTAFQKIAATVANVTVSIYGVRSAVNSVMTAFQPFTEMETAAARLASFVGGIGEAADLCRDLQREAALGAENFSQLSSAAQRLSSVFSSTETIELWVRAFNNLSAAAGVDMTSAVEAFVRMLSSGGQGASELINLLAGRGINLYDVLSQQLGASAEEIRKFATEGSLSLEQVQSAILSVAVGTGEFAGAAEALGDTFSGRVSVALTEFKLALADAIEPAAEALIPLIENVAALAEVFGPLLVVAAQFLSSCDGLVAICTLLAVTLTRKLGVSILAHTASLSGATVATIAHTVASGACTVAVNLLAAAFRGLKVALVGLMAATGIGVIIWALGEAIAWVAEKIISYVKGTDEAGDATEVMAQKTVDSTKAIERAKEEAEAADKRRQEAVAKRQREAAQREHDLAVERTRELKKSLSEDEFRDALAAIEDGDRKIAEILDHVNAESADALDAELSALRAKDLLTGEEIARTRELYNAKKQIADIEKRIVDEKRAAAAQEEEERRRRSMTVEQIREEAAAELEILRRRSVGDETGANRLERERAVRNEIADLQAKGMNYDEAYTIASLRDRYNYRAAARNRTVSAQDAAELLKARAAADRAGPDYNADFFRAQTGVDAESDFASQRFTDASAAASRLNVIHAIGGPIAQGAIMAQSVQIQSESRDYLKRIAEARESAARLA